MHSFECILIVETCSVICSQRAVTVYLLVALVHDSKVTQITMVFLTHDSATHTNYIVLFLARLKKTTNCNGVLAISSHVIVVGGHFALVSLYL